MLLQESWANKVIQVQRISNRTIIPKSMIGIRVVNFVSVYAPQASLPAVNKFFFDQLQHAVAKIPGSEILIPVGDWNGAVGSAAGGYQE